jgi:cysteine desulfurase
VRENADELLPVDNLIALAGSGIASCVYVCSENGAVQPIAGIAREARKRDILFHTDAVQAYGKLDCDVQKLGVDLMSVSAHKIGGIRGAGALYVKSGVNVKPLWRGGGQERGLRGGTESLPLIAAFAAAAQAPKSDTRPLLDYTLELLKLHDILPVPPHEAPHILMLALPNCPGQVAVRMLSDMGICVSTGSACSRGKTSPILKALNFKYAGNVIRVSFGGMNTREEIDKLIASLILVIERFQ